MVTLLRRRWSDAGFIYLASLTAVLVGLALKLVVARPRPSAELVRAYDPSQSYSFPSIIAFFSVVLLGAIVYLIWRTQLPRSVLRFALGASSVLVLALGLSRVYVGEHWATDVLGGWLFGAAWLLALVWLKQSLVLRRGRV